MNKDIVAVSNTQSPLSTIHDESDGPPVEDASVAAETVVAPNVLPVMQHASTVVEKDNKKLSFMEKVGKMDN